MSAHLCPCSFQGDLSALCRALPAPGLLVGSSTERHERASSRSRPGRIFGLGLQGPAVTSENSAGRMAVAGDPVGQRETTRAYSCLAIRRFTEFPGPIGASNP